MKESYCNAHEPSSSLDPMTTTGSLLHVLLFNHTPAACCYPEARRQAPDLWGSVREQPEWRQPASLSRSFLAPMACPSNPTVNEPSNLICNALTNGAPETTTERNPIVQVLSDNETVGNRIRGVPLRNLSALSRLTTDGQHPTPSCLGPWSGASLDLKQPISFVASPNLSGLCWLPLPAKLRLPDTAAGRSFERENGKWLAGPAASL